jgi:hypothetical protein
MSLPPRSMAVRISGPLVSSATPMSLFLAAATLRTRSKVCRGGDQGDCNRGWRGRLQLQGPSGYSENALLIPMGAWVQSPTSLWPAWSPWLKLKRATFMPASMSSPRPSSDQQAGPRVHTILVLRATGTSCEGRRTAWQDGQAAGLLYAGNTGYWARPRGAHSMQSTPLPIVCSCIDSFALALRIIGPEIMNVLRKRSPLMVVGGTMLCGRYSGAQSCIVVTGGCMAVVRLGHRCTCRYAVYAAQLERHGSRLLHAI